jgi:PAS domain S-box-containing protein
MKIITPSKRSPGRKKKRPTARQTPRDNPAAHPERQAAWLAQIVSSSNDAIVGKDLRGIITSWNQGAQRLFGYRADEAIGRSILLIIPRRIRHEEKVILRQIAAGVKVDHYETVRLRKDGSTVEVSITVSPIQDASGRIIGASKIARDISDRKKSEQLLRTAGAALLESEKQLLAMSEEERRRIGADLHDNVGQQLTAIELLCHSLHEDLRSHPKLASRLARISRHLRDAVTQTRRLARGLMPVSLGREGLADGLAEMVLQMNHGPARCSFVCRSPVHIPDTKIAHQLFHIAQEAVHNAVKHARARKIIVTLSRRRNTVLLRVEDDGRGLRPTGKIDSGLGTRIMHHRANVIGATLETKSIPGRGVAISCLLDQPA